MLEEKICSKCKQEKPINTFNKDRSKSDGYFSWCKICVSNGTKKYRENNKEKVTESKRRNRIKNRDYYASYDKQYRKANSDSIKRQRESYRTKHKDEKAKYDKEYYITNKEQRILYQKEYTKDNKEKVRTRRRAYRQNNREKKNSKNAEYRAKKIQRLPSWANLATIKEIYIDCAEINIAAKLAGCADFFVVDHIIPLQGEVVSGLHVENNLQIITNYENCSKNNKFKPLIGDKK